MSWEAYGKVAIALAIFIVPVVLGGRLARRLHMPDHGWKIALCLFTLFAGLGLLFGTQRPRLGIDLKGGVILVYEVDQQKKIDQGMKEVDMEELVSAVRRRVNPGGQKEVTIRQFGLEQIEIIIPDCTDDELLEIKMRLGQQGSLEFLILANEKVNDHEPLIELAKAEKSDVVREPGNKDRIVARWVPIAPDHVAEFAGDTAMITREKNVGKKSVLQVLFFPCSLCWHSSVDKPPPVVLHLAP